MLKRLHLRNFTVFEDADFEFGPGLNVIVGANGTGKTHVLKGGYTISFSILDTFQKEGVPLGSEIGESQYSLFKWDSRAATEEKLKSVFQPVPYSSSELSRGGRHVSNAKIDIELTHAGGQTQTSVLFSSAYIDIPPLHRPVVAGENLTFQVPVFIPAKEVLTTGWLLPLYDLRKIPVDQTYPDLLRLLPVPPLNLPNPETLDIEVRLMRLIGGNVEEEGGRYFISNSRQPRMEMNLVAEGMRKFATLYKLLANGTLTPETTLFWDEPEANLNPALLKEMAAVLTELARAGFQIILATHSLFLLKELHILAQRQKQPVRYFALYAGKTGATQVETKDDFIQLEHVAALDAELTQTFDFEAALDDEYAGDS